MKKAIIHSIQILTLCFLLSISFTSMAAAPPPPPDVSGGTGGTYDQRTGGASIGSGLFILLALGAAYGSRKLWQSRQADEVDLLKQKS